MDTKPISDPGRGSFIARFFRGVGYVVSSIKYLLDNPGLLKLAAAPIALSAVLVVLLLGGALYYTPELASWIWAQPDSGWVVLWWVMTILIGAVLIVLGYVIFLIVVSLLAGPFNDLISERTEAIETGRPVNEEPLSVGGVVKDIAGGFVGALIGLAVAAVIAVGLLLLNLIPVAGSLVSFALSALLAGYATVREAIDAPTSRRDYTSADKRRTITSNLWLSAGVGAAMSLLLLIPLVNLLVVPVAVIAGTRLFVHLERHGRTPRPPAASTNSAGAEG